jgi:hypothetical protein
MLREINYFKSAKAFDNKIRISSQNGSSIELDGSYLEKQLSFNKLYVLFVTEDFVFERLLHIYLLSSTFAKLDHLTIGHHFASDDFKLIQLSQPNVIYFDFLLKERTWKLDLYEKGKYEFSFPFRLQKRKDWINKCYMDLVQCSR